MAKKLKKTSPTLEKLKELREEDYNRMFNPTKRSLTQKERLSVRDHTIEEELDKILNKNSGVRPRKRKGNE